jgi:hypothetical protein
MGRIDKIKREMIMEANKRLLNEQPIDVGSGSDEVLAKRMINNVASEGIKNVTTAMISSPPFEGKYGGYEFWGVFQNTYYSWNCKGVEGMKGMRENAAGDIITETVEKLATSVGIRPIVDAKPDSLSVGFVYGGEGFILYTTESNKPKIKNFLV